MHACDNHSPSTGDVCRHLPLCSAGNCNATSSQPFKSLVKTPFGRNATKNMTMEKFAYVLKPPFNTRIAIFLLFHHDGLPFVVLRATGTGPRGCVYTSR